MLRGHGDRKYVTGQLLDTSFGRQWGSLLAERRSHRRGQLPDLRPTETEIAVLLSGKVRVTRRGDGKRQDTTGTSGAVWLCPAGLLEQEVTIHNDTDAILHLYLPELPISLTVLSELDLDPAHIHFRYEGGFQDPLIEQLARAVVREMDDESPAGTLLIDSISATLCAHLLRNYSNLATRQCHFPRPDGALDKVRSRRVFDYIDGNMEKKITLGDLAAEACLSPFHFARAFKALTGSSPHRYVVEHKLDYGRKLLAGDDLPICEIAHRLGFSSQSHFSRLFKNHFGATPGAYRASCC